MPRQREHEKVVPLEAAAPARGSLPYAIELWDLPGAAPERVIARAASMVLAQAIFAAARTEHLGRRIVLRRGLKVLAQSD